MFFGALIKTWNRNLTVIINFYTLQQYIVLKSSFNDDYDIIKIWVEESDKLLRQGVFFLMKNKEEVKKQLEIEQSYLLPFYTIKKSTF